MPKGPILYLSSFKSNWPRNNSLPASFEMVISNQQQILQFCTDNCITLMLSENLSIGYHTCLLFAHVGWWSTALWTARTTWTRRLGRSLTLWCITLVGILVNYRVSQKNCFCQNWPWQIFLLMIRNPLSFFMTNAGNSFCNSYIDYLPGLHI